jgi:hypothetical protein
MIYRNVSATYCITVYRTAFLATYLHVKTLMCYFHMVNYCKKNLRSHPAVTQKKICEDVYYLHTSVSQIKLESRNTEVAGKWSIDYPEFARCFSAQWILGNFTNWKIYCSEPGIASTNNALETSILQFQQEEEEPQRTLILWAWISIASLFLECKQEEEMT